MEIYENIKCSCCGKSIVETEVDSLVNIRRPMIPPRSICQISLSIYDAFFGRYLGPNQLQEYKLMLKKFGREKTTQILFEKHLNNFFFNSFECKDCASLDHDEYFDRLHIWHLPEECYDDT